MSFNVRELSYQVLTHVLYDNRLLGTELDDVMDDQDISDSDKSYIKRECTGVVENLTNIDSYIKKYTLFNIKKVSKEVMTILRIGIYEILYMDKVPSFATINECVELTKRHAVSKHYKDQHKYVNALLRKVDREKNKEVSNFAPRVEKKNHCYFRIYNDSELLVLDELKKKGIEYKTYDGALDFRYSKVYSLDNYKDIISLDSFKGGNILISDASSIYLTDRLAYYIKERGKNILGKSDNDASMIKLLDTCAAPGGKILSLIDIIHKDYNDLYAEARDVSEDKVLKISENLDRLKVTKLSLNVRDASVYDELDKEKYDVVISDVPCTGLGVVEKKPDIVYHFNEEKLSSLVALQKKIINVSSKYVKKGGILSYSTCTTTKEENEDVISEFLANNDNFKKIFEKRIEIDDENKADGFYMCFLEKI